jgi:phosphate transport system substrate-binding protein
MKSCKIIILVVSLTLLVACKQGNSDSVKQTQETMLSGNISIGGAYALFPLVKKWSDDFMKLHPDVKITVESTGTGQGIDDLRGKKIQLAMISRPLTDEEINDSIWIIPVAKEGVAPIVNQKNPYIKSILAHGVNPQKFIRLFTNDQPITWGDLLDTVSTEKVNVYTRGDESGAAVVWANFLWKEGLDLKGKKVTGDEEMIKSIQSDKLAIGYCNFSYAFIAGTGERVADIQVVPIDLDFDRVIDKKEMPFSNINKAHRGLWLGYYPKNLTRELTFGLLGKPADKAITEFIDYALSTGQRDVASTGYCELNDVYIQNSREKLK